MRMRSAKQARRSANPIPCSSARSGRNQPDPPVRQGTRMVARAGGSSKKRLCGDDGGERTGSCLIINVPSREQAEEFSRNEPFRKAGLFKSVKIARMRRGQWNPAAAQKTAEGN